jgi:hypothetical protein
MLARSSGLFRAKVYNEHGMAQRNGTGMFPREVMDRPQANAHGPRPDPGPRSGHCPEMGRLIAGAGKRDRDELLADPPSPQSSVWG